MTQSSPTIAKIPRGWQIQRSEDGAVEVIQAPRMSLVLVGSVAFIFAVVVWVMVGPTVGNALLEGDWMLGVGASSALLVLNGIVGSVFWVASSLRDRWRLRKNFLEVRDTTMDHSTVREYIGAKVVVAPRALDEGGGWLLRVQTVGREGDLFWAPSPKSICALAALLAEGTGWKMELPDELQRAFMFRPSGAGGAAQGPPPGLGFTAQVQTDGSMLMTRKAPGGGVNLAMLVPGIFCCLVGVLLLMGLLGRNPIEYALGVMLLLFGGGMSGVACWRATLKEEWRLGQDFLEIRAPGDAEGEGLQYTGGALALIRVSGKGGDIWRLIVLARGSQGTLLASTAPEGPRLLGEFVGEWTGWQLTMPGELTRQNVPPGRPAAPTAAAAPPSSEG